MMILTNAKSGKIPDETVDCRGKVRLRHANTTMYARLYRKRGGGESYGAGRLVGQRTRPRVYARLLVVRSAVIRCASL